MNQWTKTVENRKLPDIHRRRPPDGERAGLGRSLRERGPLREIRAGQAVARANGKTWGGSRKGRRLKVTLEQAQTFRRLKDEGEKIAAIARATGLSQPTNDSAK